MPVLATTAFPVVSEVNQLVRSMLNDADIPSNSTLAPSPTGAVRNANVVTITTNAPHGLLAGQIVQVSSVSDSSFSGTQTILTVPASNQFTYLQTGANATSGNGIVSLLIQGDVYTDTVLLPLVAKAYRKVQFRLLQAGSRSMTNEVQFFNFPQGATQLLDTTAPPFQLPTDFLAPRLIWDRAAGTAYYNTAPMTPVDFLPNVAQGSFNRTFAWYEDGIYFLGATQNTDIRLRYTQSFPDPSDITSQLTIRGCQDCVATYAAFLACRAKAPEAAQAFSQEFEADLLELLNAQTHGRQYQPSRRKANNRRRNRFTGFGFF